MDYKGSCILNYTSYNDELHVLKLQIGVAFNRSNKNREIMLDFFDVKIFIAEILTYKGKINILSIKEVKDHPKLLIEKHHMNFSHLYNLI